jgi:shikimate kinase
MDQPFIDLDDRTSQACGLSPAECFATKGEDHWREAEFQALEAVLAGEPAVVALGGGTPLAPGAEALIRASSARVAWLDAPDQVLLQRTDSDTNRPALSNLTPAQEIAAIRQKRMPTFHALADIQIDTSKLSTEEAAQAACTK